MKKISVLLIFMLTFMFSSTALAANWVYVCDHYGTSYYVDKDSIRRGVKSNVYKLHRSSTDGFSAYVKKSYGKNSYDIGILWFLKEDGVDSVFYLERVESCRNGKKEYPISNSMTYGCLEKNSAPYLEKIWNFVAKNVK